MRNTLSRFSRVLIIGLFFCVVLACQTVSAQSTVFTYQGSLNFNGVPANGNFDISFVLFDAATGGTQLGPALQQQLIPITNGVFSVTLNFGNEFPGANRFLEISVRQSGGGAFTTLTPRQQINSSPYAIKSSNSDSLGGVAASSYVLSGATVINAAAQFNIGGNRVLSVGGTGNVFAGVGTALSNTGSFNSFFGNSAGAANTSGANNAFFGFNSGLSNTTGAANAFFGGGSGQENIDGVDNSFFGVNTGRGNTSGSRNTFIGRLAGRFSTTGTDNTFVGFNAGAQNGSSSFNAFFGSLAGENTTGGNNAFFGGAAGSATTSGSSNSFFGRLAGDQNSTGDENSFFGRSAGNTNTAGIRNTIIGSNADVASVNLTNATAIGNRALVSQSNALILGSINGINGSTADTNVGIGLTTPSEKLEIRNGSVLLSGTSAGSFIANNPAIPSLNMRMGWIEGKATIEMFRPDGTFTTDFQITRLSGGGRSRFFTILSNGNVGIGPLDPEHKLDVSGSIRFSPVSGGSVDICHANFVLSFCSSSIRYKTDVRDFTSGLSLLRRLRPVSFTWKEGGKRDMGLIAEEVAEAEPLLTTINEKGEIEGVKYDGVGVVAVNAIKEQQAQLEAQQKEIESLKATIKTFQSALCEANPQVSVCKGDPK